MNIVILTKSEKPIYEQIYEQISGSILNGELTARYCLPSIRQIARELQIGIITVKKAYELLENDGFIYTVAGKGCFVNDIKEEQLSKKKINLAEEKLRKDLPYYKTLGLSESQLIDVIKKLY